MDWRSRSSIKQLGLREDGGSTGVLPGAFEAATIEQVHLPAQHVLQFKLEATGFLCFKKRARGCILKRRSLVMNNLRLSVSVRDRCH